MKKTTLLLIAVLLSGTAYAQNNTLGLLYESEPGMSLAGFYDKGNNAAGTRFDANGDGTADIILQRDDAQGNLQDLRVLDGRTRALIWEVQDVQTTFGFNFHPELWGFADPDGDGTREAIFIFPEEIQIDHEGLTYVDPGSNTVEWFYEDPSDGNRQAVFIGALDMTGDTYEELIIYLPDTEQVQVWGM